MMTSKTDLSTLHPVGTGYLDETSKRALRNRFARLEGHFRAVGAMLEDERCADEILLQVSAVKAALNRFSAVLLEHELHSCMNTCMDGDPTERLEKVTKVLATLLKQS
ncbi:MAG: metal-sensitive transcriptional regulator [Thermoanaerobaculia bacterium]|nr:metal-sensitive transcriptional regulator [Thermoanaerobaculia bacterium]